MFNDTDILIEENTDLEKTITDYKDNYMNKRIEICGRMLLTYLITSISLFLTPIICFEIDKTIKPAWPIIITGSLTLGLTVQHFVIKLIKNKFEKAKRTLLKIIETVNSQGVNINETNILKAKLTSEVIKLNDERKIIIKRFYLLDRKNKIRVLKEIKELITDEESKKEKKPSSLYYETEVIEELPVKVETKTTYTLTLK